MNYSVRNVLAAALVVLAVIFLSMSFSKSALALSDPLSRLRAYTFDCDGTARRITPATFPTSVKAMRVWVNSTTTVFFGGADVTGSLTKGYPVCTTTANCETASLPIDSNPVLYCRTAGGTVTISVFEGY